MISNLKKLTIMKGKQNNGLNNMQAAEGPALIPVTALSLQIMKKLVERNSTTPGLLACLKTPARRFENN